MNYYLVYALMSSITANKTTLVALVVLGAALASFAIVPTLAAQKAFAGDDHDDHDHHDCDDHDHHDHDHHDHDHHDHDHHDCDDHDDH